MILGFERFDVTAQLAETDTISVGGYLTLPERKFAADYPTNIRRLRETGRASLGQTEKNSLRSAVGTVITDRPPPRSVRAEFPHTAPTLGE